MIKGHRNQFEGGMGFSEALVGIKESLNY